MRVAAAAAAHLASPSPRAAIPFASKDAFLHWQAQDAKTVHIPAMVGKCYRADPFAACPSLPFGEAIGFRTRPDGTFDRCACIVVHGAKCRLKQLTAVAGPPEKHGKPSK